MNMECASPRNARLGKMQSGLNHSDSPSRFTVSSSRVKSKLSLFQEESPESKSRHKSRRRDSTGNVNSLPPLPAILSPLYRKRALRLDDSCSPQPKPWQEKERSHVTDDKPKTGRKTLNIGAYAKQLRRSSMPSSSSTATTPLTLSPQLTKLQSCTNLLAPSTPSSTTERWNKEVGSIHKSSLWKQEVDWIRRNSSHCAQKLHSSPGSSSPKRIPSGTGGATISRLREASKLMGCSTGKMSITSRATESTADVTVSVNSQSQEGIANANKETSTTRLRNMDSSKLQQQRQQPGAESSCVSSLASAERPGNFVLTSMLNEHLRVHNETILEDQRSLCVIPSSIYMHSKSPPTSLSQLYQEQMGASRGRADSGGRQEEDLEDFSSSCIEESVASFECDTEYEYETFDEDESESKMLNVTQIYSLQTHDRGNEKVSPRTYNTRGHDSFSNSSYNDDSSFCCETAVSGMTGKLDNSAQDDFSIGSGFTIDANTVACESDVSCFDENSEDECLDDFLEITYHTVSA